LVIKNDHLGGEVAQIMYIHVSKCKNDKIKLKKIKNDQLGQVQWLTPVILGGRGQEDPVLKPAQGIVPEILS
jgi:hypothetical protein